jgi:hypothetical protein
MRKREKRGPPVKRPLGRHRSTTMENTARQLENKFEDPAADYQHELRRLSDLAFIFLNATDNDRAEAEGLLDGFIDLVFEGGVLQTWRYRILLAEIRKGL